MEQSFFYWSQSIYAIFGILFFVILGILLILTFKKISRLEEKLNLLTDKAIEATDSTKDILKSGQKIFIYGIYEFLKNLKRRD